MLNESWEVARSHLKKDADYVSFLNDDIIVGDWFFQRVYETFQANPNCAVACPISRPFIHQVVKGKVQYNVMKKRDACAFTIRREVLDRIPPVPYNRITTFHGDDWVWNHTKKFGYKWVVDIGNSICHLVGMSVRRKGLREIKKKESNEWKAIYREVFVP
jgi:GT2 family glycosyltransferase